VEYDSLLERMLTAGDIVFQVSGGLRRRSRKRVLAGDPRIEILEETRGRCGCGARAAPRAKSPNFHRHYDCGFPFVLRMRGNVEILATDVRQTGPEKQRKRGSIRAELVWSE